MRPRALSVLKFGGMKRLLLVTLLAIPGFAAQFSNNLSSADVERITETLGFGGASRLMRSAEPYEGFPGIKIGVEAALTPSTSLNALGDGTGSLPNFIPSPRLYLAKGLFENFELIGNLFTPSILDTLSSVGLLMKWTFWDEMETLLSAAFYGGYTRLTAFRGAYTGNDLEVGALLSKDYVRMKPYLGAGWLIANGNVSPDFAPQDRSTWQSTIHFFAGIELEFPVQVTLQVDMMDMRPQGSILIAKHF